MVNNTPDTDAQHSWHDRIHDRRSDRKEQSETVSHVLPALTGLALRDGQAVWMFSDLG